MNPLTNVRNITKLNEREISLGVKEDSSWHAEYKASAWIFIGGLDFELTEGDILCVFSQYGEIVNVNLVRDKKTGKSKGYCFLCYEDQRSTNLAVDNFNGIKLTGRTIRVDHVANYRIPKEDKNADLETRLLRDVGCAPTVQRQVDAIIQSTGTTASTDQMRAKETEITRKSSFDTKTKTEDKRSDRWKESERDGKYDQKTKNKIGNDERSKHKLEKDERGKLNLDRDERSKHRLEKDKGSKHKLEKDERSKRNLEKDGRNKHSRRDRSRSPQPRSRRLSLDDDDDDDETGRQRYRSRTDSDRRHANKR